MGGGGLASRCGSCATGASAGGCAIRCSPHAPRRFPRGWEDQGSTRVRLRAAGRVLGLQGTDFGFHFRLSTHYFRPTFALRRGRQASDPAKLIEIESHDFFSGSAAVAAGHLVSADPVERVGPWRERAPGTRSSVEELFSRAWGEVGWSPEELVGSLGLVLGDVQSAAARTLPSALRGAGRARARPGCASGRPGEFSQEAISGAIFDPRSITFGTPWLFEELDKPRIQES